MIQNEETSKLFRLAFLAVEKYGRLVRTEPTATNPFGTGKRWHEWEGLGRSFNEFRSSHNPVWRIEAGGVAAEMDARTVGGVVDKTVRLTEGTVEDLRIACEKIIRAIPAPAAKSSAGTAPGRASYAPACAR